MADVAVPLEIELPPLIPLRFTGLKKRVVPTGYLNMDEALDQLGRKRFPAEWGATPAWKLAPLSYKGRRFWQYAWIKFNNEFQLRKKEISPNKRYTAEDLKHCRRTYYIIRQELRQQLESGGALKSRKLFTDGTIEEIRETQGGIWSTQMRAIFYTGYAREWRNGKLTRFRILIDRATFEQWLSDEEQKEHGSANSPQISVDLLKRLGSALSQRCKGQDYRPVKTALFAELRDAFKTVRRTLSKRQCQSALDRAPGSASKRDPLVRQGGARRERARPRVAL